MPLRHALAVVGVFLQFCGATLLIELFSRAGNLSACGYRAGVACERDRRCWAWVPRSSSRAFCSSVSWTEVPVGRGRRKCSAGCPCCTEPRASAWSSHGPRPPQTVSCGPQWPACSRSFRSGYAWFSPEVFQGLRRHGAKWWAKETFWTLEDLPQSKRARKRILRTRGLDLGRMRNGRLEPETRQEKFHWTLFFVESCAALIGGVLAGWLFIVSVSS